LSNDHAEVDASPSYGFLLHEVSRLMRKRFEQNARDFGLTRAQWQTLAYLRHMEGCSQKELAELLEIEPITLGRILDRLQEAGLVERRADERDRRSWRLYLAGGASALLEKMCDVWQVTRSEATRGLSEEELARFAGVLMQIKVNLVEACGHAPLCSGEKR
jgi:MarR family transcriptional regulator, transcriptional regulator for hemolysin